MSPEGVRFRVRRPLLNDIFRTTALAALPALLVGALVFAVGYPESDRWMWAAYSAFFVYMACALVVIARNVASGDTNYVLLSSGHLTVRVAYVFAVALDARDIASFEPFRWRGRATPHKQLFWDTVDRHTAIEVKLSRNVTRRFLGRVDLLLLNVDHPELFLATAETELGVVVIRDAKPSVRA